MTGSKYIPGTSELAPEKLIAYFRPPPYEPEV
jgi:hypothetical protein